MENYINKQESPYLEMSLSSYHVIQLKKNPPKNTVHTYDGIAIVRSAASQKTWGDLLRLILKCFTPNRVHSLSKVHIVFDYYTDNQTFSIKQTKRVSQVADKGKWLQLEMTLKNAIGQRLQRFFKEKCKQGRCHQTIQRICETRGTTLTLGLHNVCPHRL